MQGKRNATREISTLLDQSIQFNNKLRAIVDKAIEEERLIVDNLAHPQEEMLNRGQRISDKVARFGGSWRFIILFSLILIGWIVFNTLSPQAVRFDGYPFILMNLVLSCVAALQAPIIMMSQNRQEEKDRKRNENDYLINLKAELEIRSLHQKLDVLLEEQIKGLCDTQVTELKMLNELADRIAKLEKSIKTR